MELLVTSLRAYSAGVTHGDGNNGKVPHRKLRFKITINYHLLIKIVSIEIRVQFAIKTANKGFTRLWRVQVEY